MYYFVPLSSPRYHIAFSHHCSSTVWQILGLSLSFVTLTLLKTSGQLFLNYKLFLSLLCFTFLHMWNFLMNCTTYLLVWLIISLPLLECKFHKSRDFSHCYIQTPKRVTGSWSALNKLSLNGRIKKTQKNKQKTEKQKLVVRCFLECPFILGLSDFYFLWLDQCYELWGSIPRMWYSPSCCIAIGLL